MVGILEGFLVIFWSRFLVTIVTHFWNHFWSRFAEAFDADFLKLAGIFLISGVVIYFLPDTGSNLINLVYKVGLSLLVNVIGVYKLRLVYQVNAWTDKALKFIKLK